MKIVIATPLYPPDVAMPAPYVKELAKRLSAKHEVTVVAYGRLLEEVPGVRMIAVSKARPRLERLFTYFFALKRAVREADVVVAENGASVELPLIFLTVIAQTRVILHIGDTAAHDPAKQRFLRHVIERIAFLHAQSVIKDMPLPRPEVLPFEPRPTAAFNDYEASWTSHLRTLAEHLHA